MRTCSAAPQQLLILFSYSTENLLFSDVVYDEGIIPHLVRVLSSLLRRPAGNAVQRMPTAIISSTVRNPLTRDRFLTALGKEPLFTSCYDWRQLLKKYRSLITLFRSVKSPSRLHERMNKCSLRNVK